MHQKTPSAYNLASSGQQAPCTSAYEPSRVLARARPQERVLAVAMATHPRLGADSLLGRLVPGELFRDMLRATTRRLRAK